MYIFLRKNASKCVWLPVSAGGAYSALPGLLVGLRGRDKQGEIEEDRKGGSGRGVEGKGHVRVLGVTISSDLSLDQNVSKVCTAGFY